MINDIISGLGYRIVSLNFDSFGRIHGILADRTGRKYYLKGIRAGKNYSFNTMARETFVTGILAQAAASAPVLASGYRLRLPEVVKIIREPAFTGFITRYLSGKKLLQQPPAFQGKILSLCPVLVSSLGGIADIQKLKPYLKSYSRFSLALSLPRKYVKAIITEPGLALQLTGITLKCLHLFTISDQQPGLVHADINSSNIRISGKTIWLTDWEEAGWGTRLYNFTSPVCVHWNQPEIRKRILSVIRKAPDRLLASLLAYRTLILFNQPLPHNDSRRVRDRLLIRSLLEKNKIPGQ